MEHTETVKSDIFKSITHARSSVDHFLEKDIDCKNINNLTYVLNNINETGGMFITFARLIPEDNEIDKIHRDITELHNLGYKVKEKFLSNCQCIDIK